VRDGGRYTAAGSHGTGTAGVIDETAAAARREFPGVFGL
jgi:hypothetical protein